MACMLINMLTHLPPHSTAAGLAVRVEIARTQQGFNGALPARMGSFWVCVIEPIILNP